MSKQAVDVLSTKVHIVQEHHLVCTKDKARLKIVAAAAAAAVICGLAAAVVIRHNTTMCVVMLPMEGLQHFVTYLGKVMYAFFAVLPGDPPCSCNQTKQL